MLVTSAFRRAVGDELLQERLSGVDALLLERRLAQVAPHRGYPRGTATRAPPMSTTRRLMSGSGTETARAMRAIRTSPRM